MKISDANAWMRKKVEDILPIIISKIGGGIATVAYSYSDKDGGYISNIRLTFKMSTAEEAIEAEKRLVANVINKFSDEKMRTACSNYVQHDDPSAFIMNICISFYLNDGVNSGFIWDGD